MLTWQPALNSTGKDLFFNNLRLIIGISLSIYFTFTIQRLLIGQTQ